MRRSNQYLLICPLQLLFKALNRMTVYERTDFSRYMYMYITMFEIVNGPMPNYLLNCLSIKVKSKHNLRCHHDFSLLFTKNILKDNMCTIDLICGIIFLHR